MIARFGFFIKAATIARAKIIEKKPTNGKRIQYIEIKIKEYIIIFKVASDFFKKRMTIKVKNKIKPKYTREFDTSAGFSNTYISAF